MESFYKLDNGNTIIGNHELLPNTFHYILYDNNTCILVKSNDGGVYYNDDISELMDVNGIPYSDATEVQNMYIPKVSVTDPVLVSAETNVEGNKVILTFNKDMRNPVLYSSEFSVSVENQANIITLVALGSDTKTIELTLTNTVAWDNDITVSVKSDLVKSIDGGVLGYLIDNPVINNFPAEIPTLVSASNDSGGTKVILTFNIDMANPATHIADFGLKVGGVTRTITSVTLGQGDTTTIEITPTTPFVFGNVITATVISGNIAGADEGGLLETILNHAVSNIIPNNIPILVTVSTNAGGTLAILTFDMDMNNPTHSSDFTVKVGGSSITITGVALGSNIRTIEVTPTATFVNGNVITISLSTGRIKSVANGFLATVTDRSVTNIVA